MGYHTRISSHRNWSRRWNISTKHKYTCISHCNHKYSSSSDLCPFSLQSRTPDGKLPGQMHYENLCMKAVNQSIGRAIRHSQDYATILLLDHRYTSASVQSKLPGWILSELVTCQMFGQAFSAVRKVSLNLY